MCGADENNENDREVIIVNEKEYNDYYKCDKDIYLWMINRDTMSYTNEYYINIEEVNNVKPMGGYFEDINIGHIGEKYYGIDCVKAYTSCLKDMEQFPVFNLFDRWETYKNETIEDFSQYIIEIYDNLEKMEIIILFTQKYSHCYGYKLNRINNINHKICHIRRTSKFVKTNSRDYLKTF